MKKKTIKDLFTKTEWKKLKTVDPSIEIMATASWQDPDNFTTLQTTVSELADLFPELTKIEAKPSDINWRDLQKLCWTKYKTFGPLNAAINSKADYTAQGFSVYSDVYEIDLFLKDLFYSYRNKLYAKVPGWIIRMLGEGELLVLYIFDEDGNATIKNLEPNKLGRGNDDFGLITDPDDASQTIFYKYYKKQGYELIPDARFILEPDYMKEREKAVKGDIDVSKILPITKGNAKFKKIGGYRRFVSHWKNLTGIYEYLRDTSSLSTTIEWINLYVMALKWGLDHKRAISSYTWGIKFDDTPAGKVAWLVWKKMTETERDATNLTKPLTPGSRVFLMPGISLNVYSPQIQKMSGDNQDILNLSGAGARTPQDLWQGQSVGATYASIRVTRPPLVAEIESLQSKSESWFRYEFLRICFQAKLILGGNVMDANQKKYKLPETFEEEWPVTIKPDKEGNPKIKTKKVNRELCESVKFSFPVVKLDDNPQEIATQALGSKHTGAQGLGVSNETIAKKYFGINDFSRERMKKMLEDQLFGKPKTGAEAEQDIEDEFKKKDAEGDDKDKR